MTVLWDSAESTPATLCLGKKCGRIWDDSIQCHQFAKLQIRNGYYGEMWSRGLDFTTGNCSNDGVFCLQTIKGEYGFYITYANRRRYINGSARHPEVFGTWCYNAIGIEHWFEI